MTNFARLDNLHKRHLAVHLRALRMAIESLAEATNVPSDFLVVLILQSANRDIAGKSNTEIENLVADIQALIEREHPTDTEAVFEIATVELRANRKGNNAN